MIFDKTFICPGAPFFVALFTQLLTARTSLGQSATLELSQTALRAGDSFTTIEPVHASVVVFLTIAP